MLETWTTRTTGKSFSVAFRISLKCLKCVFNKSKNSTVLVFCNLDNKIQKNKLHFGTTVHHHRSNTENGAGIENAVLFSLRQSMEYCQCLPSSIITQKVEPSSLHSTNCILYCLFHKLYEKHGDA